MRRKRRKAPEYTFVPIEHLLQNRRALWHKCIITADGKPYRPHGYREPEKCDTPKKKSKRA